MADATQTRWGIGLLAMAALAIAAFVFGRAHQAEPSGSEHRAARQFVVYLTLNRVDAPIIVLGDSIVEASTLPLSVCGHPIVNAGLSGASTASDLGRWLAAALGTKRAFAIILSLGINDALTPNAVSKQVFASRYEALLADLSKLADHVAVVEFPAVETRERLKSDMQSAVMTTANAYRSALPDLVKRSGATFFPLPDMASPFTIDGVHLNADGYRVWDDVVLQAATRACS